MKAGQMLYGCSVAVFCTIFVARIRADCVNPPIVWRNNNLTCPDRAVCADVFITLKESDDGSECEERKVYHNCVCPGDSVCPLDNPAHMLFASAQQQLFTCRPVCQLPYCRNIRSMIAVSQTSEQNSPMFGGKTFTRMNCRCPRHHAPYGGPGLQRSVQSSSQRYNPSTQSYATEYTCTTSTLEEFLDPCKA